MINVSRDQQDVKTLYDAFQTKRKQMRDRVLMNIRLHCRQGELQVRSLYKAADQQLICSYSNQ